MRCIRAIVTICLLLGLSACAHSEKAKLRVPLAVSPSSPQAVIALSDQGTREYLSGQFALAKAHFEQAVAGAPASAEAHYNLGLVLFALGSADQAREHFVEAANLAPGDKVIWDSPALRPFGAPEPTITKKTKEEENSAQRSPFGGGVGRR